MKIGIWLVVLLFAVPSSGLAEGEARKALSEELLGLTNIQENTEEFLEQIRRGQMEELEQLQLDAEQIKKAKELQMKTFDLLYAELNWESLKPGYIDLYAKTFSEEELSAMILFYGSPAGRNMVAKMPTLVQKSTELVDARLREILPRIRQMMLELIVERGRVPAFR
jgi:hypothetical protein